MKLQTRTYENGNLKNTSEYSGAFVYENNKLSYINIPGGRIVNCQSSIVNYEYNLTDHLGNVRVTFTENENTGEATIIQEDHYYPFGMRMNGLHCKNTNLLNKYLYNGKEQQEQTLYYDYGFRQYDAQLGRWHVVDAMAEKYLSTSPYAYVMNNPINHIDVMGLYRGGGNQWISYPRPYLDSNSSRVGGEGMNFRNNMPESLMGLNSAHYNNPYRNMGGSFEDYWKKVNGELVYTGYGDENLKGQFGSEDNGNLCSLSIDGLPTISFNDGTKVSDIITTN